MALSPSDRRYIKNLRSGGIKRRKQLIDFMREFEWLIEKGVRDHQLGREDFEEIYSETFLIFDKKVQNGTFQEKASIKSFISSIFFNLTMNEIKKRTTKKRIPVEKLSYKLGDTKEGEIQNFMRIDADEELKKIAAKYINCLDEPCKKILIMWGYYGFDMEEIAHRMNLNTTGAARVRKHNCLKKLKERIIEELKAKK